MHRENDGDSLGGRNLQGGNTESLQTMNMQKIGTDGLHESSNSVAGRFVSLDLN